ncbi:SH2 domain-containing adapter protein F [Nibea albiflora]|uniref:SH2 domain-containing adapter protein F n=1 Tax=Nibea albiflora TaxID=240163 RepID=A0ACB7EGQ1_NIBAL|nr:SH2 domain-containing adapter protein F [Nibea albiflora]
MLLLPGRLVEKPTWHAAATCLGPSQQRGVIKLRQIGHDGKRALTGMADSPRSFPFSSPLFISVPLPSSLSRTNPIPMLPSPSSSPTQPELCMHSPLIHYQSYLRSGTIATERAQPRTAACRKIALLPQGCWTLCIQQRQPSSLSLLRIKSSTLRKPSINDQPFSRFAEIRSGGRGPKEGSVRQLPLYDTPYEPTENGGDSDPERLRCPRESRLPQDDERPPEEYDQPWEWKKERISKAFAALLCYDCISYEGSVSGTGSGPHGGKDCTSKSVTVQFDGIEKSRMSPTKEGKTRPLQRHSSGCLVNTKMTSLDHCSSSLGERIDPTMPLESQFWYHGAISRTDAESLLRLCKEASYLVRNSETSKNDYSLSLKSSQGFMHMKLSRTKENKYILGQNSCPFDSVPEIIHFYSSRKLPIKGAEHMSLLYPVAIRTL